MRVAILGFGREGKSLLKFLKKSPKFRGAAIEILDRKLNKNYLKNLGRFDLIFRSPGVPWNLSALEAARKAGVKFSSATALFFENCSAKIIGITGTKGKGTTATLLYKILKAAPRWRSGQAGKNVHLVGNIGKPALDILPKLKKSSSVILELSSFQLHDLKISPHIAVILDIFPDHQDSHFSLHEYYEAKSPIAHYQKKTDWVFYIKTNAQAKRIAALSRGKKVAVNPDIFTIFKPGSLLIPGFHNFKNAAMAATIAMKLGVPKPTIVKVVRGFLGMEHRLEFVREASGVRFYND